MHRFGWSSTHYYAAKCIGLSSILSCGLISGYMASSNHVHAESECLRNREFGVPRDRKRVDPNSPFFPSDKHPCTHAGMFIPGCHELKIFSALTNAEIALIMGISLATVERDAKVAKAWLKVELQNKPS